MSALSARRQRPLIAALLAVALTLIATQAVGAIRPIGETAPLPVQRWVIDPGPPPKVDSFRAWQTAPGTVEAQISVENAYGVQLLFPGGTITVIDHTTVGGVDMWHWRVTGLTPTAIYTYQIAVTGWLNTVYYTAQIKG